MSAPGRSRSQGSVDLLDGLHIALVGHSVGDTVALEVTLRVELHAPNHIPETDQSSVRPVLRSRDQP